MRFVFIIYFIGFVSQVAWANTRDTVYITPENFGCVSDDIKAAESNSEKMQAAIDYCIKRGVRLQSSNGKKYYIERGLDISGFIDIDFGCATLIATDSVNVINIHCDKTKYWTGRIKNFRIDLNNKARCGIKCKNVIKLHISDGEISGIGKKSVGLSVEKGYELFADNLHFYGKDKYSTGIKVTTSDCHFSDCVMINCYTAIDNQGSNFYDRIHAWMLPQYILGSTFFRCRGGLAFLTQCFSDTFDKTFDVVKESSLRISQLKLFHNKIMWKDSYENVAPTLFYFKNVKIADKTSITLIDSHIGNLIIKNKNRQRFSNLPDIKIEMCGVNN